MTRNTLIRPLLIAIGVFGLIPAAAFSYGLGGITIHSGLNEPLNADIPLDDIKPEDLQTLRFELQTVLDTAEKNQPGIPSLHQMNVSAELKLSQGQPFLHLTSEQPLYTDCWKKTFSCYHFYRFGITAEWRSRALKNRVERNYPIIPNLGEALGDVTLRSMAGQKLNAEIDLVNLGVADVSGLSVRLAPKEAWLDGVHYGDWEYKEAKRLGIEFEVADNKLRLSSRRSVRRTFQNRIQTTHAPLVLLIEAIWEKGRQLKKYTIYLPA